MKRCVLRAILKDERELALRMSLGTAFQREGREVTIADHREAHRGTEKHFQSINIHHQVVMLSGLPVLRWCPSRPGIGDPSGLWVWLGWLKLERTRRVLAQASAWCLNSDSSWTPLWMNRAVACWSHMPWLELPTLPCRCTRKGCTCTSARKEGERSLV